MTQLLSDTRTRGVVVLYRRFTSLSGTAVEQNDRVAAYGGTVVGYGYRANGRSVALTIAWQAIRVPLGGVTGPEVEALSKELMHIVQPIFAGRSRRYPRRLLPRRSPPNVGKLVGGLPGRISEAGPTSRAHRTPGRKGSVRSVRVDDGRGKLLGPKKVGGIDDFYRLEADDIDGPRHLRWLSRF